MARLRPIGHDDRLSVVDHLDELRTRLFVSVGVVFVAFCGCFALNHSLIRLLNRSLPAPPKTGLGDQSRQDAYLNRFLRLMAVGARELERGLAATRHLAPAAAQGAANIAYAAAHAAHYVHGLGQTQTLPITIGTGETFTTTLVVAGYFAVLISMPFLLYQLYAFLLPALRPNERKVALPAMLAAPVLFAAGVVFSFYEVLPPAIHFLQGYNNKQFQVLVQASSLYKFEILIMAGIGLTFQIPLLLLALQKIGVITASTLTLHWRYAIVIIAIIAAALPGVDPVSMTFETFPLILLYLASILLLRFVERQGRKSLIADVAAGTPPDPPAAS
jgi:sec-independent protein translocase protein TatC